VSLTTRVVTAFKRQQGFPTLLSFFYDAEEGKGVNLRIIIAFIIPLIFLSPIRSTAAMEVLSEVELSRLVAGAGVDIDIKGSGARITLDSFYVWDTTDHDPATPEIDFNKIEFNNIVIDDGAGGYFSFDTPAGKPITIDVGTGASGKTILRISGGYASALFVTLPISDIIPFNPLGGIMGVASLFSSGSEPRSYRAGSLVFCDQDLGSLLMDRVIRSDESLNIGAHGGVDFDYTGRLDIGELRYTYNTAPQSLTATGIHLAESAAGAPENPAAWVFTGAFKVGDISNNPATIDVGTNSSDRTSMFLNLPMQGCLRIENVNFGGVDFGPCVIDGITVHRLQIQMPGS
jgi:hypothetical protein